MKAFFESVVWLFENVIFIPQDILRKIELDNWWLANIISWFFLIILCIAIIYWLKMLKIFDANGEENKDTSAHSFL